MSTDKAGAIAREHGDLHNPPYESCPVCALLAVVAELRKERDEYEEHYKMAVRDREYLGQELKQAQRERNELQTMNRDFQKHIEIQGSSNIEYLKEIADLKAKLTEAMDIMSEWQNIDHATAVAQLKRAREALESCNRWFNCESHEYPGPFVQDVLRDIEAGK